MEKQTKHISTFLVDREVEQFEFIKNFYSGKFDVSVSAIIKMLIKEEFVRISKQKDDTMI
jgi:hypothetical protein